DRLFGESVVTHEFVSGVPLCADCAGLGRQRRNNNVKAPRQKRLINDCIASDSVRAEDPRFSRRDRLGRDDGDTGAAPLARGLFIIAVVALDEARPATIGIGLLFRKPEVGAFEGVVIGLNELLVREIRTTLLRSEL